MNLEESPHAMGVERAGHPPNGSRDWDWRRDEIIDLRSHTSLVQGRHRSRRSTFNLITSVLKLPAAETQLPSRTTGFGV